MRIFSILYLTFLFPFYVLFGFDSKPSDLQPFESTNLPAKEIAIIQLSFDGINTFYCGVGTVVQQIQAVLKEFNQTYKGQVHFKLYLLSGDYSPALPEYSAKTLSSNIKDCLESGGKVHIIPTSLRDKTFGNPIQWQELCSGGANLCAKIINENAHTIVIAHDTAYAQLPLQLQELSRKGVIEQPFQVLWVPHATSWSYDGCTSEETAKWPERHAWELKACQEAGPSSYQIGYISTTIKTNLTSFPFNVPENALMFFRTGIIRDRYLNLVPEEIVIKELKKDQYLWIRD